MLCYLAIAALIILFVITLCMFTNTNEDFRLSKSFSSRGLNLMPSRSYSTSSYTQPSRSYSTSSYTQPSRSTSTTYTQSPSLGNAYYSQSTGIVPGSYLAPLQNQYKAIFTPRPAPSSGQAQMAHHLSSPTTSYNPFSTPTPQTGPITPAPGLGLTGWVNSPYNPYGPSYNP